MRLKSLEIKGFKSFADKTVLNFDEGITGVIGPNGCGKSNIIDSIRWVIGEHKISNLRSENLESLVFNGSKNRSASGLAEVSLTFENTKNLLPTEFSTVTVTRKYYKSGESEYRLNDVACRLKDIHNLFMDTGISTDSYAIIELGMVDDIIKDKEYSRRKMLEQAAGITIYKTRKKEAKLKLDATEQDLARIEDLLFEINNQLKSLENQAKKAEKYYEIKTEYKVVSIELAKAALEGFNEAYKTLNTQQQQEVDRKFTLEAEIAKEDATLEAEKLSFVSQEKALQQLQHKYNEMLDRVRTKENEKNLAGQRLQYLTERKTGLDTFLQKADGQLKGLEESIHFTGTSIDEEALKMESLTEKLDGLRDAVDSKRKTFDDQRSSIDALRKENQGVQRNQFDAEKRVAVSDTSIQNIQRSILQLEEEQAQRIVLLEQTKGDKLQKEAEQAEEKELLDKMHADFEALKTRILETQNKMEGVRNKLAEENRILDAKINERNLLKSLVDSMEGYPESIKFLHNNKNWNHEAPILSDIIYVEQAYRAAVENVLEPYLNYYVVNNLAEGLQAVHLLDDHKKGKANFFLLDKFSGIEKQIAPVNTIAALDVVEFDEKYKKLAQHLLGNVFIATTPEVLTEDHDEIILEQTGKFVKGKYAITGGSVGLFEGKKIGRVKNLEKLSEEINQQTSIVEALKKALSEHHGEVISFNNRLNENVIKQKQQLLNNLNNSIFALQNKIENLQLNEASNFTKLSALQVQLTTEKESIANTGIALENYNTALADITQRLQLVETDYANAEQEYNFANAAFNDSNLQIARQQSKVAALKQEMQFKQNQLTELTAQVDSSRQQLNEADGSLSETAENLKLLETTVLQRMQEKEADEKQLNEADQAYYNMRNILTAKESALRTLQRNKEGVESLLTEIKDKLTELKLQLAGMKERLSVEFKVNIDDIIDEPRSGDLPLLELQERNDRMRKRLENMGEINPTAIEAFTEMRKRYEFIMEQKDDLVSAKDSLMQTIQEVEATANQQFLDTFNKTRENFQKVFKALFTEEDTADMILVDPDNLAETGIDIIAKPKGKRPSSIGQLSGGEKTLTATALLFAIYLIKPAPFCILDEVDAPLDDANVGKFTNMIKQFSENSQFIIVTHNKMTMSAVDVIYGVTMQEPGVSKLVPVDFRSLN